MAFVLLSGWNLLLLHSDGAPQAYRRSSVRRHRHGWPADSGLCSLCTLGTGTLCALAFGPRMCMLGDATLQLPAAGLDSTAN